MNWFWNRSKGPELEDRLRAERPEPRPEFLRAVASRVDARRPRTSLRLRVAFASALTLTMLVAVASVGGVSYAASGAQKAVQSVSHVLSSASKGPQAKNDHDDGPADNEYVKPCRDEVKQRIKAEQALHKANKKAATTKAQKKAENARHKAAMKALKEEKKECKKKGDDD